MTRVRVRDPAGIVRDGRLADDRIVVGADSFDVEDVDVLPPTDPEKIVCAARNYRGGFDDLADVPEEPILFLKAPNALVGHGTQVDLPSSGRVLFEGELAVVIGQRCRNVSESSAMDVVSGFTCANDLTNRSEENVVRRKSFDGAAPIGPAITPPERVPEDATLEVRVNDEVKQRSDLTQLVFDVPELIASITADLTLAPGDVVLTGSPPGMEPLEDGDSIAVDVEGLETLRHTVRVP